MKNTKKSVILFISALFVFSLCGCTGSAYNSSDAKKLKETGKKRLEEYFAENLPDAKVISVEPVSANREMTLKVLTNYIKGEYSEKGQTHEYYFDIKNRRMFTSDNYYRFESGVETKVIKDLGLYDLYEDKKAEIIYPHINIYLPDMIEIEDFNNDVGNESGKLPPADSLMPYLAPVYPIEASEDIEAYICDKDRKETIDVSMVLAVDASENNDLTKYTFDELYYAPHDENIFYRYLCIQNAISVTYPRVGYGAEPDIISKDTLTASSQSIALPSYNMYYELRDDVKPDDTGDYAIIYSKYDKLDTDTGNITTEESYQQ